MREAMFYEMVGGGKVRCGLCRFRCLIGDGERGICGVRENSDGKLFTLVYSKAVAFNVDPIEKKPLYHVMPGSRSFSVATTGCNFRCLHCQNYPISQPLRKGEHVPGIDLSPEEIVARAVASGCRSIAYTYTEPTIFYEYALDIAILAHKAGLKNVFVTNGYITSEALAHIAPFLDAANIDLKGFSERFYREVVNARLDEVLDSIMEYKRLGIWIELTTLIIQGWNDADSELTEIACFIAEEVGVETPWHVSQFYPIHKLTDRLPTPIEKVRNARKIGLEVGLRYVYEGNVPGEGGENSYCLDCNELLIRRSGYQIKENRIKQGKCPKCQATIDGIEM